jgi:hypothetical protein
MESMTHGEMVSGQIVSAVLARMIEFLLAKSQNGDQA